MKTHVLLFSIVLLLFTFLPPVFYSQLPNLTLKRHDPLYRNLTILLWHWPFGISYRLDGDVCFDRSNISGCFLTDRASAFSSADVVVFHHQELSNGISSLPVHLERPKGQRWVWFSMEPPVNNANLPRFNGYFNWTMTYRRDADIPIPYGKTLPGGDRLSFSTTNRSCFAGWVVSNFKPRQRRAIIYQNLKKHIPIEVYGKWNHRPISDEMLVPTISNCLFYLAFENSKATDYISEKLWRNSFRSGAVPVVLGPSRATYEALAPPHSFVHVEDFMNTKDLAEYLKKLATDRKAYDVYLQWHETHRVQMVTDWRDRLCQICVKYATLQGSKVYKDLAEWVNG